MFCSKYVLFTQLHKKNEKYLGILERQHVSYNIFQFLNWRRIEFHFSIQKSHNIKFEYYVRCSKITEESSIQVQFVYLIFGGSFEPSHDTQHQQVGGSLRRSVPYSFTWADHMGGSSFSPRQSPPDSLSRLAIDKPPKLADGASTNLGIGLTGTGQTWPINCANLGIGKQINGNLTNLGIVLMGA